VLANQISFLPDDDAAAAYVPDDDIDVVLDDDPVAADGPQPGTAAMEVDVAADTAGAASADADAAAGTAQDSAPATLADRLVRCLVL